MWCLLRFKSFYSLRNNFQKSSLSNSRCATEFGSPKSIIPHIINTREGPYFARWKLTGRGARHPPPPQNPSQRPNITWRAHIYTRAKTKVSAADAPLRALVTDTCVVKVALFAKYIYSRARYSPPRCSTRANCKVQLFFSSLFIISPQFFHSPPPPLSLRFFCPLFFFFCYFYRTLQMERQAMGTQQLLSMACV